MLGQEWIGKLAADSQRFFLFWHTYQIHAPYCPPDEYVKHWAPADYDGVMRERLESLAGLSFKERFSKMKTLFWKGRDDFKDPEARFLHGVYQAGIRFTDDQLGGLFQSLRDSHLLERSIVVVVADHGEEFFEHGHWQHEDLYEECLRVPLIVRLPDGRTAGARIKAPVDLVSVMPTVLELLGVDPTKLSGLPGPVRTSGVSLGDTLLTGHEPKSRPIISELINDRAKGGDFERQVAIHANDMSFLYDRVRGHRENGQVIFDHYLYDLKSDPGQKTDLVAQGGPALAQFEKLYAGYEKMIALEQRDPSDMTPVKLSADDQQQLGELGYIGVSEHSAAPAPAGFKVVLTAVKPDKKQPVAKIVAEVASIDPQVAWGLVDTVPKTVKSGLTRQEADALVKRLADAGGTA
jgi:arylsulfatase A-like enzyme